MTSATGWTPMWLENGEEADLRTKMLPGRRRSCVKSRRRCGREYRRRPPCFAGQWPPTRRQGEHHVEVLCVEISARRSSSH